MVDTYEVGYQKPPKHTRFAKGQSGNPKGRPKGSTNFTTLIQRVVSRKVAVQENGRTRRISLAEATLTRLLSRALAGDIAAIRLVVMLLQVERPETSVGAIFNSETDRALIRSFFESIDTEKGVAEKADG